MQKAETGTTICCLLYAVIARLKELGGRDHFDASGWRNTIENLFPNELAEYRSKFGDAQILPNEKRIYHFLFGWAPSNSSRYMTRCAVPTDNYSYIHFEKRIPSSDPTRKETFDGINITRILNIFSALQRLGYCEKSELPVANKSKCWYIILKDAYEEIGTRILQRDQPTRQKKATMPPQAEVSEQVAAIQADLPLSKGRQSQVPMWQATGEAIETTGIAYAKIGIVIPSNEPPGAYEVPGHIHFDIEEYQLAEAATTIRVYVGVKNVRLCVSGEGYQVVPGTLVGENPTLTNIEPLGNTAAIKGPIQDGGECLLGNPIGDRRLAVIEPTTSSVDMPSITVSLYSSKRCFRISKSAIPIRENQVYDIRREAVLNALLRKRRIDVHNRIVIAQDTRIKVR